MSKTTKKPAAATKTPAANNPLARMNPNRGVRHIDKARDFLGHFGMPEEAIKRKKIDEYLIANGHMPMDATTIERNAFRNDFLKQLRTASVSKHMRDLGLEPFDIHCQSTALERACIPCLFQPLP